MNEIKEVEGKQSQGSVAIEEGGVKVTFAGRKPIFVEVDLSELRNLLSGSDAGYLGEGIDVIASPDEVKFFKDDLLLVVDKGQLLLLF